ncbi:OmpA family protein [Flavivirga amylovorans]|uniref:OmpA family protein n=1 Tax=Flavivirga amylovorans TaxID=870486 RepID=A0ABT8X345_9FLAO|nr:OmpA family protein [Flavivirga amylovorans]MDO5988383.1 OmpA family protein [Flavivirga amylovorans]
MKTYFLIILCLQCTLLFSQPTKLTIGTNGFQFKISDTGINTKFSEIGSGFFKDKLIMVSSKKIGALAKIDPNTNEAYKELYCLDTLGKGILANPLLFSRILNTNDSEGQISFSPNQETVYYSRSSKTNSLEFKLYKAILEEGSHGNWVNEKLLSINKENVSIENPFVNAKCDKLYFSANMPNAIGGYDIYVSNINPDGTLATPKNLGEKINTPFDDKHPYVSMDNAYLFFSSKGHKGMGGFDFFVSEISRDGYKTPINMGNTINSRYDEVAYFNINKSAGYFSSNRPNGKGGFDIYYFTTNHIKQTIEGKILDFNTKAILPNTIVILKDRNQKEIEQLVTSKDGTYRFDVAPLESYTITTKKRCFKDGSFDFASYKSENTTYNKDLEIIATNPITEATNEFKMITKNIYFDFAKHSIKKESYATLNKIIEVLNNHPKTRLAINAHTDNKGSDTFNLSLSKKRAKSALNYLIKNGISKNRLLSKGYGESKPLIDCKNYCSKKDLQTNRRVEFVILSTTP